MEFKLKTTRDHSTYWRERKIDWEKQYLATWDHPHRQLIVWTLQSFPWVSLWEVGCGPGANLVKIVKSMEGRQLGGSDINADAIELARKTFKGGKFHVESVEDMMLSDSAVDVMLADATLIYVAPKDIRKALGEMFRITRNYIVLCEYHSTSWWQRLKLRYTTGYNAYNYQSLLEEMGFYDIQMTPIPSEYWGGNWSEYGHIITAKVPKK